MKKFVKDLRVESIDFLREDYILLRLVDPDQDLPPMHPGQFVQVAVENSPTTFLRRPISINDVDVERHSFDLLIHMVGDGTRALSKLSVGQSLNCIYPLGNGFDVPAISEGKKKYLLVGGGVGTAPMLLYGRQLLEAGHEPIFLLGGRSQRDLLELDRFVTHHSIWKDEHFDCVAACGPKPMMQAVAKMARQYNTPCFVSLENLMACGVGACLCCVEKTVKGNICVCTEGPVFSTDQLTWE